LPHLFPFFFSFFSSVCGGVLLDLIFERLAFYFIGRVFLFQFSNVATTLASQWRSSTEGITQIWLQAKEESIKLLRILLYLGDLLKPIF
jgi:hypothetical protein